MKKAPEVLTRMRLSCCWGDNLNVEELNEIVDYINNLEQQCKKQKEVINNAIEYIKEKQKIQYKFALSHIECDELLEILKNKEVSEWKN